MSLNSRAFGFKHQTSRIAPQNTLYSKSVTCLLDFDQLVDYDYSKFIEQNCDSIIHSLQQEKTVDW